MTPKHDRKKYSNPGQPTQGLFLDSWSALEEYLRFRPKALKSIDCPSKDQSKLESLLDRYSLDIPIKNEGKFKVYVEAEFLSEVDFDINLADQVEVPRVLALDHVTDTRNLGAILRSAAFFGIQHVIVPSDRQAPIAAGTLQTCQGALALLDVYQVTNLNRCLKSLKEKGYWVLGADMDGKEFQGEVNRFDKAVLVMGSENSGLSRNIRNTCDVVVGISGSGRLESLNVAVAAGILLQSFCSQ